jgi:hypothetical protein
LEVLKEDVPTDGKSRSVVEILIVPVFSIAALVTTIVGAKVSNSGVAMRDPVTTTSWRVSEFSLEVAATATPAVATKASSPEDTPRAHDLLDGRAIPPNPRKVARIFMASRPDSVAALRASRIRVAASESGVDIPISSVINHPSYVFSVASDTGAIYGDATATRLAADNVYRFTDLARVE